MCHLLLYSQNFVVGFNFSTEPCEFVAVTDKIFVELIKSKTLFLQGVNFTQGVTPLLEWIVLDFLLCELVGVLCQLFNNLWVETLVCVFELFHLLYEHVDSTSTQMFDVRKHCLKKRTIFETLPLDFVELLL